MTEKQYPSYKPLSFQELIEVRRTSGEAAKGWYVIDEPQSKEYEEKMRLGGWIQGVIEAYERATTPEQRYKAGSELCRLVDRISGGSAVVQGIQNGDQRYIAHVKHDGEYRIPELHVVEGIAPTQLSRMEFEAMFPDKSGLYPGITQMDREPKDVLDCAGFLGFLGIDDHLAKAYDVAVKYNREFHSGVKKG